MVKTAPTFLGKDLSERSDLDFRMHAIVLLFSLLGFIHALEAPIGWSLQSQAQSKGETVWCCLLPALPFCCSCKCGAMVHSFGFLHNNSAVDTYEGQVCPGVSPLEVVLRWYGVAHDRSA